MLMCREEEEEFSRLPTQKKLVEKCIQTEDGFDVDGGNVC